MFNTYINKNVYIFYLSGSNDITIFYLFNGISQEWNYKESSSLNRADLDVRTNNSKTKTICYFCCCCCCCVFAMLFAMIRDNDHFSVSYPIFIKFYLFRTPHLYTKIYIYHKFYQKNLKSSCQIS